MLPENSVIITRSNSLLIHQDVTKLPAKLWQMKKYCLAAYATDNSVKLTNILSSA